MQHLTRDLVEHYFHVLASKLSPTGSFVVQFLEGDPVAEIAHDAELREYEPMVTWTTWEIAKLARSGGLHFRRVESYVVDPRWMWHWGWFTKSSMSDVKAPRPQRLLGRLAHTYRNSRAGLVFNHILSAIKRLPGVNA
jgi:hypothetical protein